MMLGMRHRENTHVSLSSWDTFEAGKQSLDKANVLLVWMYVWVHVCTWYVCAWCVCMHVYVCACMQICVCVATGSTSRVMHIPGKLPSLSFIPSPLTRLFALLVGLFVLWSHVALAGFELPSGTEDKVALLIFLPPPTKFWGCTTPGFLCFIFHFETDSCCVTQVGFELSVAQAP